MRYFLTITLLFLGICSKITIIIDTFAQILQIHFMIGKTFLTRFLACCCLSVTFPLWLMAKTVKVEQWRMEELSFPSSTNYASQGADEVMMDVLFTHKASGTTLSRPAFWDGENLFLVRFAPTLTGIWEWKTVCQEDATLNGLVGTIKCIPYRGSLDIYRHGFLRSYENCKYLMYNDGTPFFYLGDTHWGMFREELDRPGPHAGTSGAESHFCYIVDRRVEQGFTVYQSEPIEARFNLEDGRVNSKDIEGFREADRYFRYIADAGLVHANAQFFFAASMCQRRVLDIYDDKTIDRISRYWVARFGAWPVLWTMAQEVDNDFYAERGDNKEFWARTNPWVKVAEAMHRHDAYSHPLSAHQENTSFTTVTGAGTGSLTSDEGRSAFCDEETARQAGHSWWAVQWGPDLNWSVNPQLVLDYWCTNRPAILYESRYCGLWTMDFGARAEGWIAFLSGFLGYGYGAIDMWLYLSTYDIDTTSFDGRESITPEDKARFWSEAIECPSAHQMRYLRSFMEGFDWWNLRPVLHGDPMLRFQEPTEVAACTDKRIVLYLFGVDESERTEGELLQLTPQQEVKLFWYNPRNGEQSTVQKLKATAEGTLSLPQRPDNEDWVLCIEK